MIDQVCKACKQVLAPVRENGYRKVNKILIEDQLKGLQ